MRREREDIRTALRTYDEAVRQLSSSYYLLLGLYLEMASHSRDRQGRLGQSPVLTALKKESRVFR